MKYFLSTLFAICMFTNSFSQSRPQLYTIESPFKRYTHNLATLRWSAAIPMGSLQSDYIDKTSLSNYSLSLEWVLKNSNLSMGGEIGRTYFKERLPRAIYDFGDDQTSAVQTRTFKDAPIYIFGNYHFTPVDARIRPYLQIAAGAHINNYTNYYGNLAVQQKNVTFGAGAGIGSRFLFNKEGNIGLDASLRYRHNFFSYDYITKNSPHLSASVGIFYRWW